MADAVMKELRAKLHDDHQFKKAFEASFKLAQSYKIREFETYGLDTFNKYIDFYEKLLTWTPTETLDGKNVYHHIAVSYFVIDLPPVRAYQTPIQPDSSENWRWLSQWLIKWAKEVGKFADKPESMTHASLETFKKAKSYHMEDYPEPKGGWKTFNEFFARKIDMSRRPIDSNIKAIVSPADSKFGGWWDIHDNAEVTIKNIPWSIETLLKDSAYGDRFAGGKFMHAFLSPSDYHRLHTPVAGKVVEAKVIPGLCYLEVDPVPTEKDDPSAGHGLEMRRRIHHPHGDKRHASKVQAAAAHVESDDLDAPDSPGYQFLQARGCIIVDTAGTENDIGYVAVLPIGMAMVSSVKLSVKKGDHVTKGQEVCYFHMGGSDVVVCFEKKGNVNITASMEEHNNVGVQIALTS